MVPLDEKYIFREVKTTEELKALLGLRYRSYRNSRLKGLVKWNHDEIDLDSWDFKSRHFGLFRVNNANDCPVGYMRVVTGHPSFSVKQINSLNSNMIQSEPKYPFPCMNYFPGADVLISNFLDSLKINGEGLTECTRFSIDAGQRSMYFSRFMIESILSVFYLGSESYNAVVACNRHHMSIYNRYGFKRFPGSREANVHNVNVLLLLLQEKKSIEHKRLGRLEKLSGQFEKYGFTDYQAWRHL